MGFGTFESRIGESSPLIPQSSFTCRFHHNATLQCYHLPVVTESVTNLVFTSTVDQVI